MSEQYLSVETRFCVDWRLEIFQHLSKDISVTSSYFLFENSPYFFKLSKTSGSKHYDLVLDRAYASEPIPVDKVFEVLLSFKWDHCCSTYKEDDLIKDFPVLFKDVSPDHFHPKNTNVLEVRILCFIQSYDVYGGSWTQSNDWNVTCSLERLSQDFSNLLKNETLPDVKLKCGDSVVPAHRSVLSARSEVFAAMFRHEMSESQTGAVDIEDMDELVFDTFLKYLYSGKIACLRNDVIPRLYEVADKYAVHTLKTWCRDLMVSGLTEDNCVSVLTFADAHSDADLKKVVILFICSHDEVFRSDVWLNFSRTPSPLVVEVYHSFVEYKTKKS